MGKMEAFSIYSYLKDFREKEPSDTGLLYHFLIEKYNYLKIKYSI